MLIQEQVTEENQPDTKERDEGVADGPQAAFSSMPTARKVDEPTVEKNRNGQDVEIDKTLNSSAE